ncbi:MAG: hypothetical protein R6V85_01900 [Polyangia bacterium]
MKRISSIIVALAALCLVAAPAGAVVPETLTYSGHLVDDGMPYEGAIDVTFELFSQEEEGSSLWTEDHIGVDVSDGLFTAELGSLESIASLLDGGVYWLQVTIGTETLAPRTPFRSVPYALRAGDADTLEGQTADDIQNGATPGGDQVGYDNGTSGLESTNMQDVVEELLARIEALESENAAQQSAIEGNTSDIATNNSNISTNTSNISSNASAIAANEIDIAANASDIAANASDIAANATDIFTNGNDIKDLEILTSSMSVVGDDFYFTGVNLNVVNGHEDGKTDTINGLGNLIVGYNEAASVSDKSGSHNVVLGSENNYSDYGGLVSGWRNEISGHYSTVLGGYGNDSTGHYASILGGMSNTSSGIYSTVSGGLSNTSSGTYTSVTGGRGNVASGESSSVSGGLSNEALGEQCSVAGGHDNIANGAVGSISGGFENETLTGSYYTWIGGGRNNNADGGSSTTGGGAVSGGYGNLASGKYSSVTGGMDNNATATCSAVSGGNEHTSDGNHDWRAGSLFEDQ